MSKTLLLFCAFFIGFTILTPNAHALVVAPFVAVGLVHFIVWLVGIISIPTLVIIKILGKFKFLKAFLITLLVLVLLAGGIFMFAKVLDKVLGLGNQSSYEMRYPDPIKTTQGLRAPPETILLNMLPTIGVFWLLALAPTALTYIVLNIKLHKWNTFQLIFLIIATALVMAVLVAFGFLAFAI